VFGLGVGAIGVGSWEPKMNGKHAIGCNCADCLEYLERESFFELDQSMPNHENISGMLRSAVSTDNGDGTPSIDELSAIERHTRHGPNTRGAVYDNPFTIEEFMSMGIHGVEIDPRDFNQMDDLDDLHGMCSMSIADYRREEIKDPHFADEFGNRIFSADGWVVMWCDVEEVPPQYNDLNCGSDDGTLDLMDVQQNLALQSNDDCVEARDLGQTVTQTITISSASISNTPTPDTYVGRRIHKKFGRKMIPATIISWDAEHNFYHVKYDDDDSEDLDINEMQRSLVPIDNYVGRRIEKRFERKWYKGTITSWHIDDKLYHVKYDDSDSEDLNHGEMHGCLTSMESKVDL